MVHQTDNIEFLEIIFNLMLFTPLYRFPSRKAVCFKVVIQDRDGHQTPFRW